MADGLEVVKRLRPVTYTWRTDGSAGRGFLAHELQAVVPEAVTGTKDATDASGKPVYQTMDTSFVVPMLARAVQQLAHEIDALKAAA